jgi:hypothetical protein
VQIIGKKYAESEHGDEAAMYKKIRTAGRRERFDAFRGVAVSERCVA